MRCLNKTLGLNGQTDIPTVVLAPMSGEEGAACGVREGRKPYYACKCSGQNAQANLSHDR